MPRFKHQTLSGQSAHILRDIGLTDRSPLPRRGTAGQFELGDPTTWALSLGGFR